MTESVISSPAGFRGAGVAVDIRSDTRDRFGNLPSGLLGGERAVEGEAKPSIGVFPVRIEQNVACIPMVVGAPGSPIGGRPKRILDIVASSMALVLLAPFLALIAVAVKLSMGGPVLYRHRRIGYNGVPFDCLKFRTMVAYSDRAFKDYLARNPVAADQWQRKRKLENDPRVTRLGHLLRKTSLDELPQFINVLRGQMSLVGPRPVVSQELELYGASVRYYMLARPGLTGLWQINGRSSLSFDQRIELDSVYVREWALAKDVQIIVQTVPAVFKTFHAV